MKIISELLQNSIQIPPKSVSELRLAREKFYDDGIESLKPQERWWIAEWLKNDYKYLDELFEHLNGNKVANTDVEQSYINTEKTEKRQMTLFSM